MRDMKRMKFSVFGDSISTYEGYQPASYLVFYRDHTRNRSGVATVEDTWWHKVIRQFQGELLINNSYSGSCVAHTGGAHIFPAACGEDRIKALAAAGQPDVLLVYLGTNDWDCCVEIVPQDDKEESPWFQTFYSAYDHMLAELRRCFPMAKIFCLSLTLSDMMPQHFPPEFVEQMPLYNKAIAAAAENNGAKLVDLFTLAQGYSSYDGAHPSGRGMKQIADAVISCIDSEIQQL